jgi:hypothetical protein
MLEAGRRRASQKDLTRLAWNNPKRGHANGNAQMAGKEPTQILIGHTDEHIKARCKKLDLFKPHDFRSVISEARASAKNSDLDQEVMLALKRRNERQLIDLLRRLGIDLSQPDAWQKGFLRLAHDHYGVGRLAWHRPRTNRNAANWKESDNLNLLMEVTRLKATGLSELRAINRIVSNPQTRRLFPYREQPNRSDFHSTVRNKEKRRQAALWRRLQHLKASSTEKAILDQLLGPGWNAQSASECALHALDYPAPAAASVVKIKRPSRQPT